MRAHHALTGGLALCAYAILSGCGSVGEPLYPALNLASRVTDLIAVERGNQIDVRFTIPPLTTEGQTLKTIGSIELRLGPGPSSGFQAIDWAAGAQKIDVPAPAKPGLVSVQVPVRDFIGKELIVGVRVGNDKGRMSEWSNFFVVAVETPLAKPTDLRADPVPDGIKLTWTAPGVTSFRIFRKIGTEKEPSLLATTDKPEYTDTSTEYGKAYTYYVQGMHDKTESDVSESAPITSQDVFPPHVPTGLTISAGVGSIELAWDRNAESDFKEYRVFRSVGDGPFVQIAAGLEGPAYSDHDVQSGKRYRYRVSAVDQSGNASGQTAPVEITMP